MILAELLETGADSQPAVGAIDADPLNFAELRGLCARIAADIARAGLGANDRIAMVLPNGPEMATSFIACAQVASAAPLNPAYKAAEFEFYLNDLNARAIIVADGVETAARDVAHKLGIGVIELAVGANAKAGEFTLDFGNLIQGQNSARATESDEALVLHTSGTTSRPKIVPLSQANLCASALNIRETLALSATDRCLNIMPLFHIHGLIAAVLSSLGAGASVHCTPGFNAMKVFSWLETVVPTWYTAVPTMHQAIVERAGRNQAIVDESKLRFIRSSSSSLPPQVMARLEDVFACPVIESYGMTEAAHQMTSNQLPPGQRKAGSVGVAAGPEVRLMNASGDFVSQQEGEIVIRGDNVTAGYEANAKANSEAFSDDPAGGARWFRTGDQGVIDDDGFLRISGRLKEIINRGGEKIAPREVDEVLMDHEAVAQVVTFAMAHEKLGEDVAAAVVLIEGANLEERALRDFAAERLASFKVPRKILFLDEIPKGATGKLQRIGLAAKLGLE